MTPKRHQTHVPPSDPVEALGEKVAQLETRGEKRHTEYELRFENGRKALADIGSEIAVLKEWRRYAEKDLGALETSEAKIRDRTIRHDVLLTVGAAIVASGLTVLVELAVR